MTTDEMISILTMKTNYSFEYLQSLSRKEVEKIYKEKCPNG